MLLCKFNNNQHDIGDIYVHDIGDIYVHPFPAYTNS